jgi:hypothetical protein
MTTTTPMLTDRNKFDPGWVPNIRGQIRIRFWTAGQLRDELWFGKHDPEMSQLCNFVTDYHQALADRADQTGLRWLVEVYDPSAAPEQAYVRFGTDQAGMRDPIPMMWRNTPPDGFRRLPDRRAAGAARDAARRAVIQPKEHSECRTSRRTRCCRRARRTGSPR